MEVLHEPPHDPAVVDDHVVDVVPHHDGTDELDLRELRERRRQRIPEHVPDMRLAELPRRQKHLPPLAASRDRMHRPLRVVPNPRGHAPHRARLVPATCST